MRERIFSLQPPAPDDGELSDADRRNFFRELQRMVSGRTFEFGKYERWQGNELIPEIFIEFKKGEISIHCTTTMPHSKEASWQRAGWRCEIHADGSKIAEGQFGTGGAVEMEPLKIVPDGTICTLVIPDLQPGNDVVKAILEISEMRTDLALDMLKAESEKLNTPETVEHLNGLSIKHGTFVLPKKDEWTELQDKDGYKILLYERSKDEYELVVEKEVGQEDVYISGVSCTIRTGEGQLIVNRQKIELPGLLFKGKEGTQCILNFSLDQENR